MNSLLLETILLSLMVLMGIGMSIIIYLSRNATDPLKRLVVYLLLAMMNGMFIGPLIYLLFPGSLSETGAVEISIASMSVEMIPFLAVFAFRILNSTASQSSSFFQGFVIFFVLADEILMSLEFSLFSGGSYFSLRGDLLVHAIAYSITSYWFVFPMSIEMALSAVMLRKSLTIFPLTVLTSQSAIMFLSPTAIDSGLWVTVTIYLSAFVMIAILVMVFEYLYRKQSIQGFLGRYLLLLLAAYSLMMSGVFIWQINGSPYLFAIGSIMEMVIFLLLVMNPERSTAGKKIYWLQNRTWAFAFLLAVFVAEFFMGGIMDLQFFGTARYVNSFGLVGIGGNILSIVASSLFDFAVFVSSISLSAWFLIMMGIEMGSLVVFKMRRTHGRETRIRLALMLAAYAVYTVYLPYFFLSDPAKVPFLGWTMGIGTVGPVSPIYLLPIFLSYVITAVLSLLFGSRQLCSTLCPASTMYQGTFYDSMKKFNRSGELSRSLTSSNSFGRALYRAVSLIVYISIGIAAVISFLNSADLLNMTIYGTDPEVLIYLIIFGFVWYAVFIAMPFVGSYGCINTGYCSWGNFNRFFSKFGLFRLKVTDPQQCVSCKTRDCATACPVGNYGQPGSFISTGEYRDTRCVGIGDCVEACPYDNIFYFDVRHWIRDRRTKDRTRKQAPGD